MFEIEINLASSWFLIAALITWSLAHQVFPQQIPGLSTLQYGMLGTVAMLLFFVSLLLHELAHALVARSFGLKVPRITLFLFGGVAELGDEPDTAGHEFWIAIAGPAMSLALASIFWVSSVIALLTSEDLSQVHTVLSYLATINLVLAVFNMLPAFPLDGGRVLRAAIWSRTGDILKATKTSTKFGEFLGFGLMALGVLALFQGLPLGGAWQIMIGLFIVIAAKSSLESLQTKTLLGNQRVADVMSAKVVAADPDLSLTDLVNRIMLPNRVSFVPVIEDGVLLGHIDTKVLSMIDRENWSNTQVGDVFVEFDTSRIISPHDNAADTLKQMAETGERKLIVAEGRRLVGVVTLSDLMRLLQLLISLKARPEVTV
ncbi:site-2 protease family protein [Pseudaestuariivita atlantica]|uniref:site-2 protease family protein n=1 Tax=Pseudaestuariivita atlantica TaxID=1317121 RepID=UPI0013F42216|nr:site-2 protease family protein [Pseudaestuariivita atlantica]